MSENITHTAVVDDALRLALASDPITASFKAVAREHWDMAHLGCITRGGDRCNPGLLETLRARWTARVPEDYLEPQLAFVLGWLCHRAADRQMKPIFRRFHPEKKQSPTECSIYHDAFLFGEIYLYGGESPYHPAMFGEVFDVLKDEVDVGSLHVLVRVLLRRALIEMHTLIPDEDNPEGWIARLFKRKQEFYVDLARYDKAIRNPDPEKLRKYIIDDNFYDAKEPIIAVARRLQQGEQVLSTEIKEALHQVPRSHYAQALKLAYGYLQAASDFFTSTMALDELKARLDIGEPGMDGLAV
jgi:uncharacterized protein (DUF2267 family)